MDLGGESLLSSPSTPDVDAVIGPIYPNSAITPCGIDMFWGLPNADARYMHLGGASARDTCEENIF